MPNTLNILKRIREDNSTPDENFLGKDIRDLVRRVCEYVDTTGVKIGSGALLTGTEVICYYALLIEGFKNTFPEDEWPSIQTAIAIIIRDLDAQMTDKQCQEIPPKLISIVEFGGADEDPLN